jgi:hypothetical protein
MIGTKHTRLCHIKMINLESCPRGCSKPCLCWQRLEPMGEDQGMFWSTLRHSVELCSPHPSSRIGYFPQLICSLVVTGVNLPSAADLEKAIEEMKHSDALTQVSRRGGLACLSGDVSFHHAHAWLAVGLDLNMEGVILYLRSVY